MSERILVVEDERAIAELVAYHIRREGFTVDMCYDGESALAKLRTGRYDLVILDLMLPRLSGWEVLRVLRTDRIDVPVIILSARDEEADKVAGLELGADDYVAKPFSPRELVARVRAHLRRKRGPSLGRDAGSRIELGPIMIDIPTHTVTVGGKAVYLTAKEFDLLAYLASNPDVVFSRERLLEEVWGFDFAGDSRTVDVHLSRLRQKIDPFLFGDQGSMTFLEAVRGVGYRLSTRALKAASEFRCG